MVAVLMCSLAGRECGPGNSVSTTTRAPVGSYAAVARPRRNERRPSFQHDRAARYSTVRTCPGCVRIMWGAWLAAPPRAGTAPALKVALLHDLEQLGGL